MKKEDVIQTARVIAPEDIRKGDYVSILHVVVEHLLDDCSGGTWKGMEQVRMLWMPWTEAAPMKVVDVCLPFVLVKKPDRKHRVIDTRRFRLARIPPEFGKLASRQLRTTAVTTE